MRRLGSLVMRAADAHRVPRGRRAGRRSRRASRRPITDGDRGAPAHHASSREEIARIPDDPAMFPLIIATGPLTSDALSADIAALVGGEHLYFYDAISPIVLAETIDTSEGVPRVALGTELRGQVFRRASRRVAAVRAAGRLRRGRRRGRLPELPDDARTSTTRFYDALVAAESATVHDFDKEKFFEGCLPIEVMAHRGRDTLRFGPMKPVGLIDPRTGRIAVRGRAAAAGQRSPATTSASSASRRSSSGASRRACCA